MEFPEYPKKKEEKEETKELDWIIFSTPDPNKVKVVCPRCGSNRGTYDLPKEDKKEIAS